VHGGLHEGFLPWTRYSAEGLGNVKILATSPGGPRERVVSYGNHVEFELRPQWADHLASVLLAAPHFMGYKEQTYVSEHDISKQSESGDRYRLELS
jgi:hypothetical protein